MNKLDEIYLQRKNKFIIYDDPAVKRRTSGKSVNALVASMARNIEAFGFTFDYLAIRHLQTLNERELTEFYKDIIPILKSKVGADKVFRVMYPNFPKQVMEMSLAESYINQLVHYFSGGTLLPNYSKEDRIPLFDENFKLQVISCSDYIEFINDMAVVIKSNTSISNQDKEHLKILSKHRDVFGDVLHICDIIPNKEILAYVTALTISTDNDLVDMTPFYKTATDVLRLAVALSDGDVSMAKPTRFISFSRKQRRFILNLLDQCETNVVEDMARFPKVWMRLGERLHPFEYPRYEIALNAFRAIRNLKVQTYNGKVEDALFSDDREKVLDLLSTRAGELSRRLDLLLRSSHSVRFTNRILKTFEAVVDTVSTSVLLQVWGHFRSRNSKEVRVFLPKGSVAKAKVIANEVPHIDDGVCSVVLEIVREALYRRFSNLSDLGNVWIDERLTTILVPSSQRSASKSTKTLSRGSRLPVNEDTKTLRAFVHWLNLGQNRVDIDLSAMTFDDDWNNIGSVWYGRQTGENRTGCHSGDITNAPLPDGAAEFVDMNVAELIKRGVRYVAFTVNSYTGQPFDDIECSFGWMERKKVNSGEIFEPSLVENKIILSGDKTMHLPVIFDLNEMTFIWADMSIAAEALATNVRNRAKNATAIGKGICEMGATKVSLYDLFYLHGKSRGLLVTNPEDADFIFGFENGDVTAYDLDVIAASYMK